MGKTVNKKTELGVRPIFAIRLIQITAIVGVVLAALSLISGFEFNWGRNP